MFLDGQPGVACGRWPPSRICKPGESVHPLQSRSMFAALPFALNIAPAAQAGVAARAITTKTTTTIKG